MELQMGPKMKIDTFKNIKISNLLPKSKGMRVTAGLTFLALLVIVIQANCTLCLSCVGACNVDALYANESDFTLRVNPSLCTACGYCEAVCPETDCLSIVYDELELNPTWFKESVLAQDKLFACVECGVEFATTKAIEKIAAIMEPIFAKQSSAKVRSLYCCSNCKPKVMIMEELNKNAK